MWYDVVWSWRGAKASREVSSHLTISQKAIVVGLDGDNIAESRVQLYEPIP